MVKLRTIQEWRAAVANPPRCCLGCAHYLADEWTPNIECIVHNAAPPRQWAEEENTCDEWQELAPF
jgi:hypothetical protein